MTSVPVIPSFHDGLLTGIVLGDKKATLQFERSDGKSYNLLLAGLEALQADDFRQGNIVSALSLVSGKKPDNLDLDRLLGRLFPPPHGNAERRYHEEYSLFTASRIERVINGDAVFVTVDSSYGCNLVAICTAVTLIPEA